MPPWPLVQTQSYSLITLITSQVIRLNSVAVQKEKGGKKKETRAQKLKHKMFYSTVLHLGCSALPALGLYASKALHAEPADLDKPDDTRKGNNPQKDLIR